MNRLRYPLTLPRRHTVATLVAWLARLVAYTRRHKQEGARGTAKRAICGAFYI